MQSSPSLLFDDTISGLCNSDTSSLFTKGIASLITNYFKDAKDIREKKVKLLAERYENNYQMFVR